MDSDPAQRNIFGLIAAEPEFARGGIRLRQFGQEIIEPLGGKKIHPAWSVPGGVRAPPPAEGRDHIRDRLPEAFDDRPVRPRAVQGDLSIGFHEEASSFGDFPSLFMGLVSHGGQLGALRRPSPLRRRRRGDRRRPGRPRATTSSTSARRSSRIRTSSRRTTSRWAIPTASTASARWPGSTSAPTWGPARRPGAQGVPRSLRRHGNLVVPLPLRPADRDPRRARADRAGDQGPDLTSDHLRPRAGINRLEGVGVSEAPRGTLFHHYQVDQNGLIKRVNLIIATGRTTWP